MIILIDGKETYSGQDIAKCSMEVSALAGLGHSYPGRVDILHHDVFSSSPSYSITVFQSSSAMRSHVVTESAILIILTAEVSWHLFCAGDAIHREQCAEACIFVPLKGLIFI